MTSIRAACLAIPIAAALAAQSKSGQMEFVQIAPGEFMMGCVP